MKTNSILTLTLATLLTAGCSHNEITEVSPDAAPAVGFRVYATPQTRGTVTNNAGTGTGIQNPATGFGVMAYYTGQNAWNTANIYTANFMWNQQVAFASGTWAYTPVKYWPNTEGDQISFFAYAPYSVDQTSSAKTYGITTPVQGTAAKPTLTFELQSTPDKLVDLVADKKPDVKKATAAIAFQFEHLLTRVNFKVKQDQNLSTGDAATHLFVTGLRLLGTADNGSNGNASGTNSSSKFYEKATYDWNTEAWDYNLAKTVRTAVYDVNPATGSIVNKTTPGSSTYGGYVSPSVHLDQNGTATSLFKSNEFLFLIPPADHPTDAARRGITAATDVRVQIDYDIVTVDTKLSAGHSKTSTSATVSLPIGTLKRAVAYDYTFTIGLERVQVSASVTNWSASADVLIPSTDAANATNTTVNAALTVLNTAKASNPNCNYFVVNVTGAPTASVGLTLPASDKFVTGDKIELKCSAAPAGTYTLTNWTAVKSGNSVVLTKN